MAPRCTATRKQTRPSTSRLRPVTLHPARVQDVRRRTGRLAKMATSTTMNAHSADPAAKGANSIANGAGIKAIGAFLTTDPAHHTPSDSIGATSKDVGAHLAKDLAQHAKNGAPSDAVVVENKESSNPAQDASIDADDAAPSNSGRLANQDAGTNSTSAVTEHTEATETAEHTSNSIKAVDYLVQSRRLVDECDELLARVQNHILQVRDFISSNKQAK